MCAIFRGIAFACEVSTPSGHTYMASQKGGIQFCEQGAHQRHEMSGHFQLLVVWPAVPHDAGPQCLTRHTKDLARSSPVGVVSHGPNNYAAMRSVSRTLAVWPLVRCRIQLASSLWRDWGRLPFMQAQTILMWRYDGHRNAGCNWSGLQWYFLRCTDGYWQNRRVCQIIR